MSTVDVDLWWRRLGSAALVGTARRPAPSVTELKVDGGTTLRPRPGSRPEEAALDAAAIGGALLRAGRLASTQAPSVEAAAPERLPEAPVRASQLLELLLTQSPTDNTGTEELLQHWTVTCRQTRHHVPHGLLPALLDRATSNELRTQVALVVGERGNWLAAHNPAWSWVQQARKHAARSEPPASPRSPSDCEQSDAAPSPRIDPDQWALLGVEERVSQVERLREQDPAAGRELVLTTWSTDPAKDRRELLEALQVNLGPDDEDFLEGALDDRAASVRGLAAQLLDGLPGSRRAARMADRLRPLLSESGLIRRALELRLPDDPDAPGRRDGLGTPPPGRSARGWWLERIVGGAPFEAWGAAAEKVVPRLKDDDAVAGLRRAAVVRRSADWARALLDRGLDAKLLAVLPPGERESRVLDELARTPHTAIAGALATLPPAWSPRVSATVVGRLAGLKPEQAGPLLDVLMPQLARALHPDAVPALQRWRSKAELPRRLDDKLGSLIQSRTLRQTISEAFQS